MQRAFQFLQEAKVELMKVEWPPKAQVTQYTLVVIGATFFMAVYLGGLDYFFSYLVRVFAI